MGRVLQALLGGEDGSEEAAASAEGHTLLRDDDGARGGADEPEPEAGVDDDPAAAAAARRAAFATDPDDDAVDEAELARYVDPWWIGTLGITLTKFADDFASNIYDVPMKYYKYTKLDITG